MGVLARLAACFAAYFVIFLVMRIYQDVKHLPLSNPEAAQVAMLFSFALWFVLPKKK
jgi:hypothetical protein